MAGLRTYIGFLVAVTHLIYKAPGSNPASVTIVEDHASDRIYLYRGRGPRSIDLVDEALTRANASLAAPGVLEWFDTHLGITEVRFDQAAVARSALFQSHKGPASAVVRPIIARELAQSRLDFQVWARHPETGIIHKVGGTELVSK